MADAQRPAELHIDSSLFTFRSSLILTHAKQAFKRKRNNFAGMENTETIISELRSLATEEKRQVLPRFFKAGPGEYGEGDKFLGVTVPKSRSVARNHLDATPATLGSLLASPWHEVRLCALLIMVGQAAKADDKRRKELFDFYLGRPLGTGHRRGLPRRQAARHALQARREPKPVGKPHCHSGDNNLHAQRRT